jgi:ferredoxin
VTFSRAALHHFAASHDRSLLAALRRHAAANGRRCRLAQSCSGCRGKAAKPRFLFSPRARALRSEFKADPPLRLVRQGVVPDGVVLRLAQ